MTERFGVKLDPEDSGVMVGRESMGCYSRVLKPTLPVEDVDSYWVWGDGEWVQWGDGEEMEQ